MTLREFRDVLNSLEIPVFHGLIHEKDADENDRVISWIETKRKRMYADCEGIEVKYNINVTLFSKVEYDEETLDKIEKLFDEYGIAVSDTRIDCIENFTVYAYTWQTEIIHSR